MKTNTQQNVTPENNQKKRWPFWLWLVSVFTAVFILVVIFTAWSVRHAMTGGSLFSSTQSRAVVAVAEFPGLVVATVNEIKSQAGVDPLPLLMDKKETEKSYWKRSFPAPDDSGYLLFSGSDPVSKHSVVQLIRVSDGFKVASWDPDWSAIFEKITSKKYGPVGNSKAMQAVHPLLLSDGDIVFNMMGSGMVRLNSCSSKPVWVIDEVLHHSNELASSKTIWTSSVSYDGFPDNASLRNHIRDDALALVSTDGRLLEKRSFAHILRDNDLQAMLSGGPSDGDVIHLNQISVAPRDSMHWLQGDLLISAARISTVFLYRPSTGKIIWHQTGPWVSQHSVDFVDDHRISVFDNNVIYGEAKGRAHFSPDDINRVILYDFDTKTWSQPFKALLEESRPDTLTEGRGRVLPDGGLFIEETNYGRHMRFTKDHLLWSRVNDYDDQRIGAVSWSRYLTAEEVRVPLQLLSSRKCSENM